MDEERLKTMSWLAEGLSLITQGLDELDVTWWVRNGWSLRKLEQTELESVEVDDKQEVREVQCGSGEELRRGDGDAGTGAERKFESVPRDVGPKLVGGRYDRLGVALVREALSRKAKPARRRRRRR